MVPDQEHRVEAGVQALHHVHRLVPPGHVGGPAVQRGRVEVEHGAVRVVAYDLGSVGLGGAVDGRVDLAEKQPAALLVGLPGRAALRPVDDPGHALHVARDEDLHPSILARVLHDRGQ